MNLLRRLIERLLDLKPSAPGQGTSWNISADFPWPTWVLLLFVLFAVLFVVGVYRRDAAHLAPWKRWLLSALRLSTLGTVLFLLSQALLLIERTGLPYLLVLVDVSNSMGTVDSSTQTTEVEAARRLAEANQLGAPTRLAQAQGLLLDNGGQMLRRLVANHKVRLYTVAEGDALLGPESSLNDADIDGLLPQVRGLVPAGNESRLGDGLRNTLNSLRGSPPSAVVLLSDGVSTDGESLQTAAQYARQRSVPIYTVALGSADPQLDLELHNVLVDETAFVGEPASFAFTLTARGLAGKTARVQLRNETTGDILASRDLPIEEDGRPLKQEIAFTPRQVGDVPVIIEAVEIPQESNTANNRESRRISVRDEKLRVLLVDQQPRWEFRQLKDLLGREKTVELKTVLLDADPEFTREDRTALANIPVTREELFEYDVCVLGDIAPGTLSASVLDNLRDFVSERGRGLLLIAGPNHAPESFRNTSLEPLFPIELEGVRKPSSRDPLPQEFHPELTPEARKGSALFRFADSERESLEVWNFLPGVYWSVDARQLRPGALAWAVHPQKMVQGRPVPLIATQRFGGGRVLYHGIDETWRWRYRLGDTYFGRYWVQALRYLAHSRTSASEGAAELLADRKAYQAGDPVTLRLRFLNERLIPADRAGVRLVVESAGGGRQDLELKSLPDLSGVFEGQLAHPPAGKYHVFVGSPTFPHAPPALDFEVRASERESRSLRAEAGELNRVATLTGGRFYTVSNASRLASDIPPGLPVPLEPESPFKIWNHWVVLLTFLTTLIAEWLLRKRWRLT